MTHEPSIYINGGDTVWLELVFQRDWAQFYVSKIIFKRLRGKKLVFLDLWDITNLRILHQLTCSQLPSNPLNTRYRLIFQKVEQIYLRYEYLPFFWNTLLKDIHALVSQISRKKIIKIQEIYPTFFQTIASISFKNASHLFTRYAKCNFIIWTF